MLLVVDVVEQPGHMPKQSVVAELDGVALHRCRNHLRVQTLVFIADVLVEEGGGSFFGREGHGEAQLRTKSQSLQGGRSKGGRGLLA